MKILKIISIFFLLLPVFLFAQNKEFADSLVKELNMAHNIEKKAEINFLLSHYYLTFDIDESYAYGMQAINLISNVKSSEISGKIYSLLGDISVSMDSLNLAKKYYKSALNVYEKQNNTERIVILLTVLGNIAYEQDNFSDALQYYQEGITIAKEHNFLKGLNRLYLNIGSVFSEGEQVLESQEYFSKSLDYFLKTGDSIDAAIAYHNLGMSYINLGDETTGRDYLNKSLEICSAINASIIASNVLLDLSGIEFQKENYLKSKELLIKTISIVEDNVAEQFEGPRKVLLSKAYVMLGNTYFQLHKIDSTNFFARKGLNIALQNRQLRESSEAARLLSKLWQSKNNIDSAFYYHVLFKNYSDSLLDKKNSRNLAYQQAVFNFQQEVEKTELAREKENEIHNRNILILAVTVVFLILTIAVLGLFFQLNRIRMKKSEVEQQNLQHKLELKNKELATYLMYQVKNNEFILNISKKLKSLLWKGPAENKSLVNEIIREIETDSSADNWEEFIIRFQQVHIDFYKNLGKKFPELTSNELRICAFLKLNMNTKDIAAITYQSQKSITVARWRLRQKLGLKKEERLSAFLAKF